MNVKDVSNSVTMDCGVLCVMMHGELQMPMWSADNLDYHLLV